MDTDLARAEIEVVETAFRAPNTNAYVERFIQTIQHECLDHFVILGLRHLNHLIATWLEHYHTERPHQAKENDLLVVKHRRKRKLPPADAIPLSDVRCEQRLGGLLRHYYRKAA